MPRFSYRSLAYTLSTVTIAVLAAYFHHPTNPVYCYDSIKTLNKTVPSAQCFEVSPSGTFTRVWSSNLWRTARSGHVIPGLWDGHGHIMQYGELLHSVDIFGSQSMEEVLERVRTYANENPHAGTEEEWLRGVGWDQAAFGGQMPIADDLASISELRGKYIMLDRVDVHCIWVSQAVLNLLPHPVKDVPGGEIIGEGVFCDNAMDLVLKFWPKPGYDSRVKMLRSAMRALNKVGLVGVHDAGITDPTFRLYEDRVSTVGWTLRVYAMLECEKRNTFCHPELKRVDDNDMFRVRSVKLFADGALGSWGSALIDPYSDRPDTTGSLLVNDSTMESVAVAWAEAGYQVNIHAIGDLANRVAINAVVAALRKLCPTESLWHCQHFRRFRIEHAQILHPEEQARMHAIGIIPSIQPTHATSDMYYAADRLGEERTAEEAYRMRSLLPLSPVLGSDFPVEPPSPFAGIYAAVTRRDPKTGKGRDGGHKGWHLSETLTLEQALRGFTTAPARAAFWEGKAGVIREGAFADWVVLDKKIDDMDIEEFRDLRVKETWVAGKRVYARDED
ncbi:amidohydrolase 3 [Patellaria atrata CBS 101060]|uniref:Amidohydrolase 3 n=1 Tax=Patellaria atrata CBS 101060 TaxID=1346257 RepID=A0A9P4SAJ3_9PEZI|nr:amidohydrolase 3 [Patellaria atrata CBS 101060]